MYLPFRKSDCVSDIRSSKTGEHTTITVPFECSFLGKAPSLFLVTPTYIALTSLSGLQRHNRSFNEYIINDIFDDLKISYI